MTLSRGLALGLRMGLTSKGGGKSPRLNTLFVGQSNAAKMFEDFTGAGNAAYIAEAEKYFNTVNSVNGAKSSAAVRFEAAGSAGAYLNSTNDGKGAVYTTELDNAVTASGIAKADFDIVFVNIGETDAVAVNNGTITEVEHKQGYFTLCQILQEDFVNAVIVSIPLNSDTNSTEFVGWGETRRAQYQLSENFNFIKPAPLMSDLLNQDDLHFTQAGYETMGVRLAQLASTYVGKENILGKLGPSITGFDFDTANNQIFININHDAGTDFTVSAKQGWTTDVDGTLRGAQYVQRENATQIRTRFSSYTITGTEDIQFNWPWGTLRGVTNDKIGIFIDNATNPRSLRPYFANDVTGASAYISNVNAAGGALLQKQQDAISNFVSTLRLKGLWGKIDDAAILCGSTTLSGALVKFKGDNAITNVNFVDGDYDESLGLTGDGSTKYLDLNYNPVTDGTLSVTSTHLAVYSEDTSQIADSIDIGTSNGTNQLLLAVNSSGIAGGDGHRTHMYNSDPAQGEYVVTSTVTDGTFTLASRIAADDLRIYIDGDQIGTTYTTTGGAIPNENMYLFAFRGSVGSDFYSSRTLKYYSAGQGLSASEVRDYNAAIKALIQGLT